MPTTPNPEINEQDPIGTRRAVIAGHDDRLEAVLADDPHLEHRQPQVDRGPWPGPAGAQGAGKK